ncbi:hypothetical protein HLRTI_000526 [Halorhabdus tiamatea SARL4B]|uniref:Uncharacterized protein n=1 Tax=Halorhabdus tiamatea SARL4B TaxID=1033806 RepID=F7PLX0_9EURY|nr:hypothetical protein [Halorhabdus tiamatea]ERJ07483.1 hypothetical protein HLRTI_000526 [Halorhabdus tiamatea SARL4B]
MQSDPPSDGDTNHESDQETWNTLTVMQGPEVSGRNRIWFGYHDTWEKFHDPDDEEKGTYTAAEPVQHIPLPRRMNREEIFEWLAAGEWDQKYLKTFDERE